ADPSAGGRRRWRLGLGLVILAAALLGGIAIALMPRVGTALPDGERVALLEQAGLPADFPVHPYARRAPQPSQGGISYVLAEPVPDVLVWHERSLVGSGYEVFSADVEGQDEYLPHWLFFKGDDGTSGAIIIRESGRGLTRGTEVKILSRGDPRLAPPTVPAGAGGGP
ncbi:MAG: hypothetical protein ACRDI2_17655, partial [Chloroflexota bacterium]